MSLISGLFYVLFICTCFASASTLIYISKGLRNMEQILKGLISALLLVFFIICIIRLEEYKNKLIWEEIQKKENTLHSNLFLLPEGRYILNHIISADSAKVRFVLQLPGTAKRRVEVIAYDDSPIYWNEWQAEYAALGDTLIIRDIWTNDSTGNTYNRTVQKLGPDDVGLGYVSNKWLERPN